MCQFFSGIITKNKTIWDYDNDNHTELIQKAGLKDTSMSPEFVRVELLPKDKNIFNQDLDNWKIKVDQDFRPDWFTVEFAEHEMKEAIKKVWKERFIIDQEIEKLVGKKIRFVKNSKIKMSNNSHVGKMSDNSHVGKMSGNSQVSKMWGNSQVSKMSGNSQVGEMWGNSHVGKMFDNSTVKIYSKYTKIKDMKNNAMALCYYFSKPRIIRVNSKIKFEKFKKIMKDFKTKFLLTERRDYENTTEITG